MADNATEIVQKKPTWKKLVVWAVWIVFALMVIAKLTGGSVTAPEGIDQTFYLKAIDAFNQLDIAYQKGEPDDKSATAWLGEQLEIMEKNPSTYSQKEKEVLEGLKMMMVAVSAVIFDESGIQPLDENSRQIVHEKYRKFRLEVSGLLNQ